MVHIPRWQIATVLAIVLLGLVYALPNLLPRSSLQGLPDWVPQKQINLGLDLQGGSYLLIQVELEQAFEADLENTVDQIRLGLRGAGVTYTGLGIEGLGSDEPAVVFEITDPAQRDAARDTVLDAVGSLQVDISDDRAFRITMSEAQQRERTNNILNQTIEIIRRRIDETGTREPSIQRHGDDRVLVQLPGVENPDRIKDLLQETAALAFRFVDQNADPNGTPPPGTEILPGSDKSDQGKGIRYVVSKRVIVKGENLTDAQSTFQNAEPVVSFKFDTVGAKKFADATRDNVGRVFAVVLDDEVISAPVIREPILGGSGIISGNFTVETANDLALLLRAGALPADLTYLEERTVGPGLGADSVRAGKIAATLGLVFVILFMAVYYGLFGLMADVALIANLVLIVAALSVLQATLTLPGIAGIVLTIGMAVDANVLIFERIREELTVNGRGPVNAIDAGYKRAMTTIVDSNLTTLIAAVLLFQFGSGPIKGFAVTLAIGLVTSMFTAIMLTRLVLVTWLRRRRPKQLAF
ncbi:MAG TPA: protein translocase subunit SecD [Kiloniellaceae bacterium]|nr:protein translocase subunit SecD [Kiloniellaceae bacterium]